MKFIRERQYRLIQQQTIIDSENKLTKIKLDEMRKIEKIKSSFFVAEDKLIADTNLEEQRDDKAIEIATKQIKAIIYHAEAKSLELRKCARYVCPYCQKAILFGRQLRGKIAVCPNVDCKRQIKLPNFKD